MKRECRCEVPIVDFRELPSNTSSGESSETIRQRVIASRRTQVERFKKSSNSTNSAMGSRQVRQHCRLTAERTGYLEHSMEEMNFSARAHAEARLTNASIFLIYNAAAISRGAYHGYFGMSGDSPPCLR